ncbi:hypothetical protein [Deinococcus sp. Marseille-Q6407]|uniref:hypothetical protein n=1 Tax=Deinococcus sp. Marseille-Q6407 TaxID=2969223 RepID=UPI0021C090B5|nr:hypothetical protein [Deinococcus sp. Marseille-Q6407]
MQTALIATLALVLGGAGAPAGTPSVPVSASPVAPAAAARPVVQVPLHFQEGCRGGSDSVVCSSSEAALSAEQVTALAGLFGLAVRFRPAQAGEEGPFLDLSVTTGRIGLTGIGTGPRFKQGGKAYYSASTILGFTAQVTDGAYFTATPQLSLHTGRATLNMGPVSPQRQREFFSGLAASAAGILLQPLLNRPLSCDAPDVCHYPGISTYVWGGHPQRIQTGLPAGEVALLVMTGQGLGPEQTPGIITAASLVQPGGWATFYLPQAPAQLVTDPARITLQPQDAGNALLVRLTGTPLDQLAGRGIVRGAALPR